MGTEGVVEERAGVEESTGGLTTLSCVLDFTTRGGFIISCTTRPLPRLTPNITDTIAIIVKIGVKIINNYFLKYSPVES